MEFKRVIRLVVACLVVFTAGKLYFNQDTGIEDFRSHAFSQRLARIPGHFWRKDSKGGPTNVHVKPRPQTNTNTKPKNQTNITHSMPKVINNVKAPVKSHKGPLRVVHLDLKGAAPRVSYFQELFPLISSLGADGILVEYEDMFPYERDLVMLRSPYSYSADDIEEIRRLAGLYNLEIIPLVQVFGHLEFVLKHSQFFDLREVPDFPNSLNPLHPGSLKLVEEMLTQVLEKHPQTRWFHIGADEVYSLGESKDSQNWMKQNKKNVGELFLSHVTKVCKFLTKLSPGIKPIFWEDMLRKLDVSLVKESGLPDLATPVIWKYDANIDLAHIEQLLSKYRTVGFHNVWFASAFKGASGINQRWTPIQKHLENHLAWLKVKDIMHKYAPMKLDGIALTGWQRYEHHTVLCELLPVAIPSLAVCLQTLKYGQFNKTAENEVERLLGCKVDLKANSCTGNASFPGVEVYHMVQKIHNEFYNSVQKIFQDYHLKGSFGPYQRKYNFANPRNIGYFKGSLTKALQDWDPFMEKCRKEMMFVYFEDTVEEWMEENVNENMNNLYSLYEDVKRITKFKGQKKSLNQID